MDSSKNKFKNKKIALPNSQTESDKIYAPTCTILYLSKDETVIIAARYTILENNFNTQDHPHLNSSITFFAWKACSMTWDN